MPVKLVLSFFFRFLWWLTFVAIAVVVLALVYREWIVREIAEKKISEATGMDAEIGEVSFSVLQPKLTLENLKLYNNANFGGTLFADAPEAHVEFDRAALKRHQLHITLLRLNVSELDVVKNGNATNIFAIAQTLAPVKAGGGGREFAPLSGCAFNGIDVLNVSLGAIKFIDLKHPSHNRTLAVAIQNKIIENVKTPADLDALGSELWDKGAYLMGLPVHKVAPKAGIIKANPQ